MVIEAIPGGAFVLESVATAAVVGAAYAHLRHERDRSFDVDRAVATYAFLTLMAATGVQVILAAFA